MRKIWLTSCLYVNWSKEKINEDQIKLAGQTEMRTNVATVMEA